MATRHEREQRLGKPAPNPFKRKRARNQRARYLTKLQSAEHRNNYNSSGNLRFCRWRGR